MTNRRGFLQGAAVATVPLVAGLPEAALSLEPVTGFHAVIVDPRHPESLQFGARLMARGVRTVRLPDGDLTQAWLTDIAPAWRDAPVPLAGLTRPATLFCLEQFAWAHGLRVSFHAEHVLEPSHATGHLVHRLVDEAPSLRGPWWPSAIADLVASQAGTPRRGAAGPSLAGQLPRLPVGAELLTSWLISPA